MQINLSSEDFLKLLTVIAGIYSAYTQYQIARLKTKADILMRDINGVAKKAGTLRSQDPDANKNLWRRRKDT